MLPNVLDWDSKFFGFSVARVDWSGDVSQIAEAIAHARKMDVTLLYVFGPADANFPGNIVNSIVSIFKSQRVELAKELIDGPNLADNPEGIIALAATNCNVKEVSELGVIAGSHSRFMCDPIIPRTVGERLFRLWAENSLRGVLADANFGYWSDSRIMGFVSVRRQETGGRIMLIAVRREARGEGIGSRLVRAAESYVAATGGDTITVATQGHNEPAFRLYHSAGYKEVARSGVWHVWLKPPSWDKMA
ncbi:MAG: GNAT family N-acetyltransferase [Thermogutta sp.]|uniref:GNAT family N-acetyltransferase n=1 Tax=Thermogutta sp. TaxID=1962930 RepID=UPI0019A49E49|nr:GNAT family N-acetyltransferase [Thermogutta sp.]MBC7351311.1 GNAT family N-acetyltransferase [Thermogutta sp.]